MPVLGCRKAQSHNPLIPWTFSGSGADRVSLSGWRSLPVFRTRRSESVRSGAQPRPHGEEEIFHVGGQLRERSGGRDRRFLGRAQLHSPSRRGGVAGADPEQGTFQGVSHQPDLIARARGYRFAKPLDLARGLPGEGGEDGFGRRSIVSESSLKRIEVEGSEALRSGAVSLIFPAHGMVRPSQVEEGVGGTYHRVAPDSAPSQEEPTTPL